MKKVVTLFAIGIFSAIIGLCNSCNGQETGPLLDKIVQQIEKRAANNENKIAEIRKKIAEAKATRLDDNKKLREENEKVLSRIKVGEGLFVQFGKRLAALAGWIALAVGILSAAIIGLTLTLAWAYLKIKKQIGV